MVRKKLHAVALLLQGVVRGGGPLHGDGGGFHLQGLLGLGGEHHRAGDNEGRAHILAGNIPVIVQHVGVHDYLQIFEAGAVVELNKPKGFHIPDGAGPAAHSDRLSAQGLLVGKDGGDGSTLHN